jgi:hypothetical protein
MSHFSSNFSLGNHRAFFRFLMIPSQVSGSDESQCGHSLKSSSQPYEPSSYHSPIWRWVEQVCGNTCHRDVVPPSHPRVFDSIFDYVVVIITGHDHVTPSHLGVTRGDHVSWSTMKTMIPEMIINILHRQQPLRCLPPHHLNSAHSLDQHGSS